MNVQTKQEQLNVALLGCGAVSTTYYGPALQELQQHGKVEVKALFDLDRQNMAGIQKLFPKAFCASSMDQLQDFDVDLAIVASPPPFHAEQTIQLLHAGIDVLCEKPMATSVADGEAMVAAAEQTQRMLAIGLVRRFFPAAQMIHQLLTLNLLGAVKSFTYYEGDFFSWPAQSASFFQRATAKGGVLLDIGVHVLDLLIWWWGQPVEVRYSDDAMGGIEANCHLHLKFAQGETGVVRLSRDCTLSNQLEIQCEQGTIRWPVKETDKIKLAFKDEDLGIDGFVYPHGAVQSSLVPRLANATFEQCFLSQLLSVASAVQGKREGVVTGADGLQSLRLIESCYRHRTLMEMSWFGEKEAVSARLRSDAVPSW